MHSPPQLQAHQFLDELVHPNATLCFSKQKRKDRTRTICTGEQGIGRDSISDFLDPNSESHSHPTEVNRLFRHF